MQTLVFRAMNTDLLLAVAGHKDPEAALQRAKAEIEEYERRFSRFLPDSELSHLNQAAGQWATVSDDLLELLTLCKAYFEETGGLFDPAVLPDLKRVGYDVSLEKVRMRGDAGSNPEPRTERAPFSDLEIDTTGKVRLPVGMQIDLGGIAKGWIVQKVAERLKADATGAAVSAGGDIFFAGAPAAGERWRVEIADPRDEQRTAAVLWVPEGAVVTSSVSKRTWQMAGVMQHHIIDPRTGEPAHAEWLSVSVIAPRGDLAEAYAKALLIGGQEQAARLMLQRPRIAVLSITTDGQVLASHNSKDYLNGSSQYVS